jgi:putative FmdB family regulatory protein
MPIYAYRCQDCGFEKDQLQKISDAPLTQCPSCGGQGFARVLTAPAFQLKGSGWYATDFRDQGKGRKPAEPAGAGGDASGEGGGKPDAAGPSPSGTSDPSPSGNSAAAASSPSASSSGSDPGKAAASPG